MTIVHNPSTGLIEITSHGNTRYYDKVVSLSPNSVCLQQYGQVAVFCLCLPIAGYPYSFWQSILGSGISNPPPVAPKVRKQYSMTLTAGTYDNAWALSLATIGETDIDRVHFTVLQNDAEETSILTVNGAPNPLSLVGHSITLDVDDFVALLASFSLNVVGTMVFSAQIDLFK